MQLLSFFLSFIGGLSAVRIVRIGLYSRFSSNRNPKICMGYLVHISSMGARLFGPRCLLCSRSSRTATQEMVNGLVT